MSTAAEAELKTVFALADSPAPVAATCRVRRLKAAELFGGAREVVIEHANDEYRLRITHQGKLILTK